MSQFEPAAWKQQAALARHRPKYARQENKAHAREILPRLQMKLKPRRFVQPERESGGPVSFGDLRQHVQALKVAREMISTEPIDAKKLIEHAERWRIAPTKLEPTDNAVDQEQLERTINAFAEFEAANRGAVPDHYRHSLIHTVSSFVLNGHGLGSSVQQFARLAVTNPRKELREVNIHNIRLLAIDLMGEKVAEKQAPTPPPRGELWYLNPAHFVATHRYHKALNNTASINAPLANLAQLSERGPVANGIRSLVGRTKPAASTVTAAEMIGAKMGMAFDGMLAPATLHPDPHYYRANSKFVRQKLSRFRFFQPPSLRTTPTTNEIVDAISNGNIFRPAPATERRAWWSLGIKTGLFRPQHMPMDYEESRDAFYQGPVRRMDAEFAPNELPVAGQATEAPEPWRRSVEPHTQVIPAVRAADPATALIEVVPAPPMAGQRPPTRAANYTNVTPTQLQQCGVAPNIAAQVAGHANRDEGYAAYCALVVQHVRGADFKTVHPFVQQFLLDTAAAGSEQAKRDLTARPRPLSGREERELQDRAAVLDDQIRFMREEMGPSVSPAMPATTGGDRPPARYAPMPGRPQPAPAFHEM